MSSIRRNHCHLHHDKFQKEAYTLDILSLSSEFLRPLVPCYIGDQDRSMRSRGVPKRNYHGLEANIDLLVIVNLYS